MGMVGLEKGNMQAKVFQSEHYGSDKTMDVLSLLITTGKKGNSSTRREVKKEIAYIERKV